jgi:hypothetical protein
VNNDRIWRNSPFFIYIIEKGCGYANPGDDALSKEFIKSYG